MKTEWRISDLCSHIPDELIAETEPAFEPAPYDADRMMAVALSRLEITQAKPKSLMRRSARWMLVAALIAALTLTAFTALGVFEFFKVRFGGSTQFIANQVEAPLITAEANNIRLSVDATLTDGYAAYVIFSLQSMDGTPLDLTLAEKTIMIDGEPHQFPDEDLFEFEHTFNGGLRFGALQPLSTNTHAVYMIRYYTVSPTPLDSVTIDITLLERIAPLKVSVEVARDKNLATRRALITGDHGGPHADYTPREIEVNALGVVIRGDHYAPREEIIFVPYADLSLKFKDGRISPIYTDYTRFEELTYEEHMAAIATVHTLDGEADAYPDEITLYGVFEMEFIDLNQLESVLVDGVEYLFN